MTRNNAARALHETDNTVSKSARAPQLQPYHYKPGQSGNPVGRPRGARSKLSEAVIAKLLASFEAHGDETIERVRANQPAAYLAACVSLLPKQQEKIESPFADLTEDELELLETFLRSQRAKPITTIDATAEPMSHEARTEMQPLTRAEKAARQHARAAARAQPPSATSETQERQLQHGKLGLTTLTDEEIDQRLDQALANPDRNT